MTREDDCDLFKLVFTDLLKLALTNSNWFLLIVETACDQFKLLSACCWNWLWQVQTSSYWLLKLTLTRVPADCEDCLWIVQTGSCWLLKLAKARPNQLLLVVHDRGWYQLVLVLTDCWNWLWLIQTGSADCWNCLWPVQTGSSLLLKLAVTSSNFLLLVVEIGCDQFKLVLADCWNWLKQDQTSSYWLCMTREDHCHLFKLVFTICWN